MSHCTQSSLESIEGQIKSGSIHHHAALDQRFLSNISSSLVLRRHTKWITVWLFIMCIRREKLLNWWGSRATAHSAPRSNILWPLCFQCVYWAFWVLASSQFSTVWSGGQRNLPIGWLLSYYHSSSLSSLYNRSRYVYRALAGLGVPCLILSSGRSFFTSTPLQNSLVDCRNGYFCEVITSGC